MISYADLINEQVDKAIEALKIYKETHKIVCLKAARKALKTAILIEERVNNAK